MRVVEICARSVDEAIKMAAEELKLSKDEFDVEVLEESSKGFLGILGGKQAKIRAAEKPSRIKTAKRFLEEVTEKIGLKTNVIVHEEDDLVKMTLNGANLGSLIGRRGETLDALQYLTNLVANKQAHERKKIVLDAEGYRQRREETLITLARRLADKVARTGTSVILEPMNPQERRIIHTALQNDQKVQTLSEGEDPFRKVVISPR